MNQRDRKIIGLLVKLARPKILKRFRPDSCIASTRVAIDVLEHYGIHAVPRPCRAYVFTHKLWKRVKAGTFAKPFLPGEWSIGVGFSDQDAPANLVAFTSDGRPGYNGHLVALIEDDGDADVLIDLSLDQASRPEHGIIVEPASFMLPRRWRDEHFVITMPHAIIHYNAIENDGYLVSRDWTDLSDPDRTRHITANLISLIDKKL